MHFKYRSKGRGEGSGKTLIVSQVSPTSDIIFKRRYWLVLHVALHNLYVAKVKCYIHNTKGTQTCCNVGEATVYVED